jgi:hypothetical protein
MDTPIITDVQLNDQTVFHIITQQVGELIAILFDFGKNSDEY